jgi:hypothetical protein
LTVVLERLRVGLERKVGFFGLGVVEDEEAEEVLLFAAARAEWRAVEEGLDQPCEGRSRQNEDDGVGRKMRRRARRKFSGSMI